MNKLVFKIKIGIWLLCSSLFFISCYSEKSSDNTSKKMGVKKISDMVIYKDSMFYSTFPSVIKRPDGEIIVAFRRAPNRKIFGENYTHVDPNSYLVKVSSKDGKNWTKEPELIYAHPFGGSQDPCMLQLHDGTILCASYWWLFLRPDLTEKELPYKMGTYLSQKHITSMGGYILSSDDGGKTWNGPVIPPNINPDDINAFGQPKPALNRGAMYEGKDHRIFWAVAARNPNPRLKTTTVHLLISEDKGQSWKYSCPIAAEDSVKFNETSLYETPRGDIVAFIRTGLFNDQACIARSTDGGKTFQHWKPMGFQGHPLQATRLPDNRVLLVYGYRHKPMMGIRARILNPECTDYETAEEIIIRDEGEDPDLGYPWSVVLDDSHVLVVYYFNIKNRTRYIAGSVLELD